MCDHLTLHVVSTTSNMLTSIIFPNILGYTDSADSQHCDHTSLYLSLYLVLCHMTHLIFLVPSFNNRHAIYFLHLLFHSTSLFITKSFTSYQMFPIGYMTLLIP